MPSDEHERHVALFLKELTKEGWRTINLNGKAPDAIAVKDGKICAVEILTSSGSIAKKRELYNMFDEVFFHKYPGPLRRVVSSSGNEVCEYPILSRRWVKQIADDPHRYHTTHPPHPNPPVELEKCLQKKDWRVWCVERASPKEAA